jgi:hypothetical protein
MKELKGKEKEQPNHNVSKKKNFFWGLDGECFEDFRSSRGGGGRVFIALQLNLVRHIT